MLGDIFSVYKERSTSKKGEFEEMLDKMDLQLFGEMEDVAVDKLKEVKEDYPGNTWQDTEIIVLISRMIECNDLLERLAIALEGIESHLEGLAGCVHKTKYGSFLSITGNVPNHEE